MATAPAASASSPASASLTACGDTITADTALHSDLLNCPGNGIVIGADHITLNLNGHTLAGVGVSSTCARDQNCDAGVDNLAGHDGVTIVGGTIQGFRFGINARGVEDNTVKEVSASHNTVLGVFVRSSTDAVIERTSVSGNGINGLVLDTSQGSVLRGNSVTGSHGYGIFLFNVNNSVVQDNTLEGNDHGISGANISHNSIRRNLVTHSGGSAIDLSGTHNRIEHNRLIDNGDGIIPGDDNLISHNVISGTGFLRLSRHLWLRADPGRRQTQQRTSEQHHRRPRTSHLRDVAGLSDTLTGQPDLAQRREQQAGHRNPY